MKEREWIEHLEYLLSLSRSGRNRRSDWKKFKEVIQKFDYRKGRKLTDTQKARKKFMMARLNRKKIEEAKLKLLQDLRDSADTDASGLYG